MSKSKFKIALFEYLYQILVKFISQFEAEILLYPLCYVKVKLRFSYDSFYFFAYCVLLP